jgi:hypothetical protein
MAKKAPETNPFVQIGQGFVINAVWKSEELTSSGEVPGDGSGSFSTQLRVYRFERDSRVSLYTDGLLGFFPGLSTSSKDMLLYIASRIQFNSDVIELEEDKYCVTMNVSRSTFFTARKELTNRIIVPRTSRKNTYWINPGYMFKGNRMEKYPEAVRMHNTHPFDKYRVPDLDPDDVMHQLPDPE